MIEIRPAATEVDEKLSLAVYNAVWPRDAATLEEVHAFARAADAYVDYVAYLDGVPVGSLALATFPKRPRSALVLLTVLAEHRRKGVGRALYEEAKRWAAARSLTDLDAAVPEDDGESRAYAERRGFRVVEHNSTLVLELAQAQPQPVEPPAGIAITTWAKRPDLARGIYEVECEASADVPSDRPPGPPAPYADWLERDWNFAGLLAEGTMLAVAGDEVVGYAKLRASPAQPGVAYHEMTGVRRAWRGRGVARALKQAQVAWARRAGYQRLRTQNELRNEPMRRINDRLGYRVEPGRLIMRGPLAGAETQER